MNQKRLMILLPAVLLIAGLIAWLVIDNDDASPTTDISEVSGDQTEFHNDAPLLEDNEPAQQKTEEDRPLSMTEADVEAARTARENEAPASDVKRGTSVANPENTDSKPTTQPRGTNDGNSSSGPPATSPKRQLTRAEQEEERRRNSGRPALQKRLARTPAGATASAGTKKSVEQEKWEEEWYAEGFNPPEMTPTPVRGKIMSEQAREGLASATVGLISFFPLDGVAGGKLLPVITELETDENGFFNGEIPASKLAPLNYPPVALAITWESHRIVTASPVETLVVGQQNELGIFWAPEIPYQLRVDATQFDNADSVVTTGELDPQRWHPAKLAETLSYFPSAPIAREALEEGPPLGHADLIATWDGAATPYVTLLAPDTNLTRRPKHATIISNKTGSFPPPAPFDVLVFENDAYTPISGQVVDADGAAVASAVLTTQGGQVSQSVLSDAAGWFYFENPPEKTHSIHCVHGDFVETVAAPVKPGDSDVSVVLTTPRPRIPMYIVDSVTQAPIADLSIKVIGINPWGEWKGTDRPAEYIELMAADGQYLLEWEFEIYSFTLEKIGYFPKTLQSPMALLEQSEGVLNIELTPGRKLEVSPRNYTAVEREDRWFPDNEPTSPGIYTAWSHHWIEYEIDFGEAPEEGEEGGSFDILLGCTNRGIVDNEYQFMVDVYVDGTKKDTLTIIADSLHPQTGRTALGQLSGVHTIRLVWTNDKWIPDQLDANIRYDSLKFLEQP